MSRAKSGIKAQEADKCDPGLETERSRASLGDKGGRGCLLKEGSGIRAFLPGKGDLAISGLE